ncbi:uncharacterized protein LOC132054670 [Lycium ferocissimum]|uniref:uncharacterized protein LOC132054670 n=1 Tax=Lycium ferocissimum TaxID=112874 RepID=UPI0028166F0F|nr:uncharacterized protein LOC132054670 [Lycium ferocissimum]
MSPPFTNKYPCLMLMVILCIFLFPLEAQSSDYCFSLSGCAHGKPAMQQHMIQNRKVLYSLKEKETVTITVNGKPISRDDVELREAPMSPDPLHHSGGKPRNKPQIMP